MKSCLVVDDSKVIRMVARRILEEFDFEIDEAENGREAQRLYMRLGGSANLLEPFPERPRLSATPPWSRTRSQSIGRA